MIHDTKNVASAKTLAFCSNANRGNIAKITSNDTDAYLSDVPDNVGYDDKLMFCWIRDLLALLETTGQMSFSMQLDLQTRS